MAGKRKRRSPTPRRTTDSSAELVPSSNGDKAGEDDDDDEVTFRAPPVKRPKISTSTLTENQGAQDVVEPVPAEPRRSPNGYVIADRLPEGFLLVDRRGDRWTLGKAIGLGGFGEIYTATSEKDELSDQPFVIKVEPHSNGPLFVEVNFYLRVCQKPQIDAFRSERGLEHLGLPHFVASGFCMFNNKKLRFLVLPKYGMDLQSVLDSGGGKTFSTKTACAMAIQVLNSLEYIHSHGYIHKDIKGSNLLLDDQNRLFVVDFGLRSKFMQSEGIHRPFVPDRRWAHEGTLEYTSRDFHLGCFSRRGDIEILLYNLIEWLGGKLPWEELCETERPPVIQEKKIEAFLKPQEFLESSFHGKQFPSFLSTFMSCVDGTYFEEVPAYEYLRGLLMAEMTLSPRDEVSLKIEMFWPDKNASNEQSKENYSPNKIAIFRPSETGPEKGMKCSHISLEEHRVLRESFERQRCEVSLRNPTPAMVEVMAQSKQSHDGSSKKTGRKKRKRWSLTPSPLTPPMITQMNRRSLPLATKRNDDDVAASKVASPTRRKLNFKKPPESRSKQSDKKIKSRRIKKPRVKTLQLSVSPNRSDLKVQMKEAVGNISTFFAGVSRTIFQFGK